jgi:hypothetical protein
MRVHFLNIDREWRHPKNHLDGRVCPDCGSTVHGWEGQRKHQHRELILTEMILWFLENHGHELPEGNPWTAVVDGDQAQAEIEGPR